MANNVINAQIQEAYDTEANWIAKNTVLLKGQMAFSSDKQGYYKVGNGTSTWSQLPYAHVSWANIDGKPSTFYTHPSSTAYANGLYKITTNSLGHVTGATAVTKADITALGIPAQDTNTVYTHPSSHAATMITQDASHRFVSDTEKSNWNAAKTHADSAHAPANAEVNQNAFSNVKVGTTTIAADAKTDTLELVGSNITLTPDATNDKVTIGLTEENVISALGYTPPTTDTKYTHPTTAGNKHIPAGGSAGQFLKWSADGTAIWANDNNTTYSAFKGSTSTVAGGIGLVPAPAAGVANRYLRSDGTWVIPPDTVYTLPIAGLDTLGGVKTTSSVTSTSGLTACPIISGIPYYKNTIYSLSSFGITVSATELNYTDGVTSNIQSQLDNKSPFGHSHTWSEITSKPTIVNNATTTTANTILDGRMGKSLQDQIDSMELKIVAKEVSIQTVYSKSTGEGNVDVNTIEGYEPMGVIGVDQSDHSFFVTQNMIGDDKKLYYMGYNFATYTMYNVKIWFKLLYKRI